MQKAMDIASH